MDQSESAVRITVDRRRAIFRAVVEAQDGGQSVSASRADAAKRFEVSEVEVKAIEQEGLEKNWPPL